VQIPLHCQPSCRGLQERERQSLLCNGAQPVQVNVRVAAGELGVGCVIRLTEYTINMVNGAARPLVLGAPHGSHLTHPVRQVFCTAGSVCQSPCGTAAGDRSNHACSIGMRADSGPVAPRWGPASQRRRGYRVSSLPYPTLYPYTLPYNHRHTQSVWRMQVFAHALAHALALLWRMLLRCFGACSGACSGACQDLRVPVEGLPCTPA